MKINCDVCEKDVASVFCVADEAALCSVCDHRVHHANKLAGKHQRFSLLHPEPNQAPVCDICQDKKGFLFCQQDRAILCRECDLSIHKANEHTQKHARFLLTGVKISAKEIYSSSLSSEVSSDAVPNLKSQEARISSVSIPLKRTPSIAKSLAVQSTPVCSGKNNAQLTNGVNFNGSISASSISEYLIETLPGWHVEDFLDSASPPPSFFKNAENEVLPFWDADLENNVSSFPNERMGVWVPQAPPPVHQKPNQSYQSVDNIISFGSSNGSKEFSTNNNMKPARKWNEDNSFAVPQIIPSSTAFKRSRTLW